MKTSSITVPTMTARIIAGIPIAIDVGFRIAQMKVVTIAKGRWLCGGE